MRKKTGRDFDITKTQPLLSVDQMAQSDQAMTDALNKAREYAAAHPEFEWTVSLETVERLNGKMGLSVKLTPHKKEEG